MDSLPAPAPDGKRIVWVLVDKDTDMVAKRLLLVVVGGGVGATTEEEEVMVGEEEEDEEGLREPVLVGVGEEEALVGEGGVETTREGAKNPAISTKSSCRVPASNWLICRVCSFVGSKFVAAYRACLNWAVGLGECLTSLFC